MTKDEQRARELCDQATANQWRNWHAGYLEITAIAAALRKARAEGHAAGLKQARKQAEHDAKLCRSCGGYEMGAHFCQGRSASDNVNAQALYGKLGGNKL